MRSLFRFYEFGRESWREFFCLNKHYANPTLKCSWEELIDFDWNFGWKKQTFEMWHSPAYAMTLSSYISLKIAIRFFFSFGQCPIKVKITLNQEEETHNSFFIFFHSINHSFSLSTCSLIVTSKVVKWNEGTIIIISIIKEILCTHCILLFLYV